MKALVRKAAIGVLNWPLIYHRVVPDGLAVFLYHDVEEAPSRFVDRFDLNIRPDAFRKQIKTIAAEFDIISIDDLLADVRLPRRSALITFDDGYRSVFSTAQDILAEHSVRATVFMNMGVIAGEPFWSAAAWILSEQTPDFAPFYRKFTGRYPHDMISLAPDAVEAYLQRDPETLLLIEDAAPRFVGRDMLADAERRGVLHLGNHLWNHYNAQRLTDVSLAENYLRNRDALSNYSNSRQVFSYPFGQPGSCYNDRTERVVRGHGAILTFSARGRINAGRTQILHRFSPHSKIRGDMAWNHLRSASAGI